MRADTKNNQMATTDIFLKNHEYGDIKNTALMRSFSLEYVQYNHQAQRNGYMFQNWKQYIDNPVILVISWALFGLAAVGLVAVIIRKEKPMITFAAIFLICFAIIGNDIPVVSKLSQALRTYVPLFHNLFRLVFTKFFTVYAFGYALLLGYGLLTLTRTKKIRTSLSVCLLIFGMAAYTYPSFTGNFLHKQLRVTIPQDYFSLFTFFQKQNPNDRIAVLPAPWYWAWTQYRWGVIGSGFQWFGIPQPLLDRAFDPWSDNNENFYWEISQALYTSDKNRFEQVLKKYQVKWLIVDNNILTAEKPAGEFRLDQLDEAIENTIRSSSMIIPSARWNRISVYHVEGVGPSVGLSDEKLPNVGPQYKFNDYDAALSAQPWYTTQTNAPWDVFFPFRSLFTGKTDNDREFKIEDRGDSIRFIAKLPDRINGYQLGIPAYNPDSLLDVDAENDWETTRQIPSIYVNGQLLTEANTNLNAPSSITLSTTDPQTNTLEINVPKVYGYYSYDSEPWNDFQQAIRSCDGFNIGELNHELYVQNGKKVLRLTSTNSSNCINFDFAHFPQRTGYLVTLETKNTQGNPLLLDIINKQTRRTFLDTYITGNETTPEGFTKSYMIIPPMEFYSLGYSLNLDSISIGREKTVNELRRITIFQIPYELLTGITLTSPAQQANLHETPRLVSLPFSHPNPALYSVQPGKSLEHTKTIALSQSFDSGWLALNTTDSFPYIKLAGRHVLVNNWANGWTIENQKSGSTIYLVFWPQILEFVGFGLFAWTLLSVILKRKLDT